jgi:hypothetical protein
MTAGAKEVNTSATKQSGGAPGGPWSYLTRGLSFANHNILYLNNSKFFAGVIMILLNVGSKFITIQFSKSTEEYMKMTVTKQLLVFAMAWMGTRDIYTALGLTAIFVILSEHLFNEESSFCIVHHQYRVLEKVMDTNGDGEVSESELASAISVLEKARREKKKKEQQSAFFKFNYEKGEDDVNDTS